MKDFLQKKHITALIALFFAAVLTFVFYISEPFHAASRDLVRNILQPGQEYVSEKVNGITLFLSNVNSNIELAEKYDELFAENIELLSKVSELEGMRTENEELRKLVNMKEQYSSYVFVGAEVIAKNEDMYFYTFTANRGSDDGVQVNDAVINGKGLVGRVSEVGKNTCTVKTLLDESEQISAIITKTRDLATVYGEFVLKTHGQMMVKYIPSENEMIPGDIIETSGLGGIYAGGLLVGTVQEILEDISGIEKYAVVIPVVDYKKIREVIIMTKDNQSVQTDMTKQSEESAKGDD